MSLTAPVWPKEGRSQTMRFTVTSGVDVADVVDGPESARAALEHFLMHSGVSEGRVAARGEAQLVPRPQGRPRRGLLAPMIAAR